MWNRNKAYDAAVAAAMDSYAGAIILKTLADILLPETDTQLRDEINAHYTITVEYRRSVIIYYTTVQTFMDVDSMVKASIDKLNTIRRVGETYIDDYDQTVINYITEGITEVYKHQSNLQKLFVDASSHLSSVKTVYKTDSLSVDEKQTAYNKHITELNRLCEEATTIYASVAEKIGVMKTKINEDTSLKLADTSRKTVLNTSINSRANLANIGIQINNVYTQNITDYTAELARRRKWYDYYRKQADLVRERKRVVIDPAVFRRLLNWAHNAHLNAVYAALYALFSGWSAEIRRHTVHPDPDNNLFGKGIYTN